MKYIAGASILARRITIVLTLLLSVSCGGNSASVSGDELASDETILSTAFAAEVISVEVSGDENNYTFNVGMISPDTGCAQYADWWEVITPTGELIHRRVLDHSHVDEQPFIRSSGPVNIAGGQEVIVRGHMNTSGNGVKVFTGSVTAGFVAATLPDTFAEELQLAAPLPASCAF
jgi:hypothetical protein